METNHPSAKSNISTQATHTTYKGGRFLSNWAQRCFSVDLPSDHWTLWFQLLFFDHHLVGPFDLLWPPGHQHWAVFWITPKTSTCLNPQLTDWLLSYNGFIHYNVITKLTFYSCFFQTWERKLKPLLHKTDGMIVPISPRLLDINSRAENLHWHSHHDPGDDILGNTKKKIKI